MSCATNDRDISALVDGELNPLEERQVRQHLSGCASCKTALARFSKVSATLRSWDREHETAPSEGFARSVISSLASRPASRPRGRVLFLARMLRAPAVAAAVLLLTLGLSVAYLLSPAAVPDRQGPGEVGVDPALAELEAAFDAARTEWPPIHTAPATVVAEIDTGGELPPPARRLASPRISEEEKYRDLALARLREHRELEDLLRQAESRKLRFSQKPPVASTGGNVVSTYLATLKPQAAIDYGSLTVIPLYDGDGDAGIAVVGLEQALAEKILVIEENALEGRLKAGNRDRKRHVFLARGEILHGGRQDRILTRGVLIPPNTYGARLPVLCCEQNRSTGQSDRFLTSPGVAPPGIRRLLLGAQVQDRVWAGIAKLLSELRARNQTNALRVLFSKGRGPGAIEVYAKHLLPALENEAAVGFLAFSGSRFLGGEVFANHALLEELGPRFLAACVLEAIGESRVATSVRSEEVGRLLASVVRSSFIQSPGVVFGQETEFEGGEGGVSGAALVPAAAERPLHISLFPGSGPASKPADRGSAPTRSTGGSATPPPPNDPEPPPAGSDAEKRLRERQKKRNKTPKLETPRDPAPKPGIPGSGGSGGGSGGGAKKPPQVPGTGGSTGGSGRRRIDERR